MLWDFGLEVNFALSLAARLWGTREEGLIDGDEQAFQTACSVPKLVAIRKATEFTRATYDCKDILNSV